MPSVRAFVLDPFYGSRNFAEPIRDLATDHFSWSWDQISFEETQVADPKPALNRVRSALESCDVLSSPLFDEALLFSPTIGAAIAGGYWFLWVRCPACRTTNPIDLRTLDRHHDAAVTSLIPALSCRSCRPNAPFAELVRLSRISIADEMREEHRRRVLGN